MRQKMISNEINLLRDTFQRLIRRKANTNLGKLIDKRPFQKIHDLEGH